MTRCLIITPTRELAAQCVGMHNSLGRFTELRASLIVGGSKNSKFQATELRTRPDTVVCTPGRLLDHITNSPGVHLDDIEFLVLDEADRLLQLGFTDEVMEIVNACPIRRQTLLFSATMNTKVDDLVKLSLKRPVRIAISSNPNKSLEVAPRLTQEFIRIRPSYGKCREAILLSVLTRNFKTRTIVFFDTKSAAHRFFIIGGLCGIKCAQIHGNLTQVQRLEALEAFRNQEVDILMATDVAARGLDINGVETVINFEMPPVESYIHRIGRTARAGRRGRSCTLISEHRRPIMKTVIRDAKEKMQNGNESGLIQSRTVPPNVIKYFNEKVSSLEAHIKEVIAAETVAKLDRLAEMEVQRAENIIKHHDEIKSRPVKQWPTSKIKQEPPVPKKELKKEGTGYHNMTRKKRRAREARESLEVYQKEMNEKMKEKGQKAKNIEDTCAQSARATKKELKAKRLVKFEELTPKKKKKTLVSKDSIGDSSLFQLETVCFSEKGEKTKGSNIIKSQYHFRGFDPTKKLGKKKGSGKFKSKSKFKRKK